MISSPSTLFLAALVLTTSVIGAPIRTPVAPSEVAARAESVPELVVRAAIVDVQPLHKRSGLGKFSRRSARLPTETEPVPETAEVPAARAPEEPEVRRQYPRRIYHEYYEKREPQPEPVNVPAPAPVVQKRERVYPRRIYYEHYEKRAPSPEPATQIQETTVEVTKTSTFDSIDDLAAANSFQLLPNGSDDNTQTSTLFSLSQTQTIPTPGSAATVTEVVNVVNGIPTTSTITGTPSVVTVTVGAAVPTANPSVVTVTAGAVIPTANPSVVTVTAGAAIPTNNPSVVTVTAGAAIPTNNPSVVTVAAGSPPVVPVAAGSPPVATVAAGSPPVDTVAAGSPPVATDTGSATAPAVTATPTDNTQPPIDPSQPSGGTLSFAAVRRNVATEEPPVRRAYSGASWASFVRRQSN
jgi:hypothetical protein